MTDVIERELVLYQTQNGRTPYLDWLLGLKDRKARARIRARINRLILGNLGDVKSVGGGVAELRVSFGPGYRVYFGQHGLRVVVLLCGGDKSSQANDIRLAKIYWEEFKRAN